MLRKWHYELLALLDGDTGLSDCPPSSSSINRINTELSIQLPRSLIQFVKRYSGYSKWVLSLDLDSGHSENIITMNNLFHEKSDNGWIPEWFIMINSGHDGVCWGFDTRNRGGDTDEYPVLCWNYDEGRDFKPTEVYIDFPNYLEGYILWQAQYHLDNINRSGSVRAPSREIVPKIEQILRKI